MPPANPMPLKQQLIRSCAEEGIGMRLVTDFCEQFGIPAVFPEPEVARADLARIRCKSLAGCIAKLIAEHEPMLKAEADGATVVVRERGGSAAMRFTVEAE
jgi:hypothetical protein